MVSAGGVPNRAPGGQWTPLAANPRHIHSVVEGPRRVLDHIQGRSPAKLIQVHIVDVPQVGRQGFGISKGGLGTCANRGGAHCPVGQDMCPTLPRELIGPLLHMGQVHCHFRLPDLLGSRLGRTRMSPVVS